MSTEFLENEDIKDNTASGATIQYYVADGLLENIESNSKFQFIKSSNTSTDGNSIIYILKSNNELSQINGNEAMNISSITSPTISPYRLSTTVNSENMSGISGNSSKKPLQVVEYVDRDSLRSVKHNNSIIRNKNAIKGMQSTQKNHHRGPYKIQFQENKKELAKTKYQRVQTIFKKAKELSVVCNLDVGLMVLDKSTLKTFFTNNGLLKTLVSNDLKKIADTASVTGINLSEITKHVTTTSEKRMCCDKGVQCSLVAPTNDANIHFEVSDDNDNQFCGICGVKADSPLDWPPSRKINHFWLKCTISSCRYFVHGHCIGLGKNTGDKEEQIRNLSFLCPFHTKNL